MPNPTLEIFGKRLRTLRQEKKLSQEKLAEMAELHRTYLGGVERGERNPTLLTLERIAKAINLPLSELVDFEIPSPSESHVKKTRR